jgi:hypothetical protein
MEIGDYIILPATDSILEIKAENTDLKAKNSNLFGIAVGCLVLAVVVYSIYVHNKTIEKKKDVLLVKV